MAITPHGSMNIHHHHTITGNLTVQGGHSINAQHGWATTPYEYVLEDVKVTGKLASGSSITVNGVDIIEDFFIIKMLLMENPQFKELYEQEILVRKLRGDHAQSPENKK